MKLEAGSHGFSDYQLLDYGCCMGHLRPHYRRIHVFADYGTNYRGPFHQLLCISDSAATHDRPDDVLSDCGSYYTAPSNAVPERDTNNSGSHEYAQSKRYDSDSYHGVSPHARTNSASTGKHASSTRASHAHPTHTARYRRLAVLRRVVTIQTFT